ncbi:MAG: hypothetical protein RLZZ196_676 [Bacteroidota bacterium]|jgi:hypothetical protein
MKRKIAFGNGKVEVRGLNSIEDGEYEFDEEILESIREDLANIEATEKGSAYQIPTQQPYRLSDSDDFPFGTYIHTKTGRMIENHFRLSDQYNFKQDAVVDILNELEYKEIYSRDFFGSDSFMSTKVYEKKVGDGVILFQLSSFINKWTSRASKYIKKRHNPSIEIFSNIDIKHYNEIIDRVLGITKVIKHEENNIALVIQTPRGYDTTTFELPKQQLDIELNYGKSFKPIHEKIITKLNESKSKGLVLLHGTPGTGKTHYLKYIASKIKNKRVLFIPPFLADFITSPEMTPFLIQNSNSVLFIEDAERVITDRTTGGSTGVSNILNLTDGILSDILNIQIVATFNMDKKQIDEALLRKGRLIAEHKFEALPVDDCNALLKHLGKQEIATKPMTLTEIYNVDEVEYKSEDKGRNSIGFNRY